MTPPVNDNDWRGSWPDVIAACVIVVLTILIIGWNLK
jgi:hypothetical protein